jgi:hypothetical protein
LMEGMPRAASSSAPASADSTASCRIIRRSSTASASDGRGLPGRASPVSGTSENGPIGPRRHRC